MFVDRAKEVENYHSLMSEKQSAKIWDACKAGITRTMNSDTTKALCADISTRKMQNVSDK